MSDGSELRAGSNECLALIIERVLLVEVVDEHLSELLGSRIPLGLILVIPLGFGRILVGILRIEDFRSNAFELRRDLEAEVRDLLRRSFVDGTAVDGVDNAARILDGDALAIAVPARVDEVCLRAIGLYALNKFMRIFRRRQLEEGLTEASGERRRRLRDAALRASQLGREAGEEVILHLFRRQDGNRRQDTESIGCEEDDALGSRSSAAVIDKALDRALDVIERIRYTRILRDALVGEINLAILVEDNVLEECVALDGAEDVRLCILVEVDDLCIAAAFEVEDTIVIPAVLIIADQQALRIRRQRRLARAGEAEEDSRYSSLVGNL